MILSRLRRGPLVLPAGTPPLVSLNAATANGTGTAYNLGHAFSNWEVQVTATGSPSTCAVQLQGCLDGATFVNIGSPITTLGLVNVTSNTPLSSVQLVLSNLTGGTNPTVTGIIVATEAPAGSGGGGGAVTQSTGAGAAAPWSVELSDGSAFYTAAKDATLSTTNTQLGGLTETAPATDIASSGLNGRLQRIAQRLTSLIALLPAALISGRLDVNLGAAPAAVTANQGTQGAGGTASWPVQGAAAAGAALAGNPVLMGVSDGTNAQTARQIQSIIPNSNIGVVGYGATATALHQASGDMRMWATVNSSVDNSAGGAIGAVGLMVQNSLSAIGFDRVRNNVDVTLLSSGARTTTQTSANITTYNAAGITVWMNTTAFGTSSNTLSVVEVDPASGAVVTLLASAAIVANGTTVLRIFPGITAAANVSANLRIPRVLQIIVTVGNANPSTYSVGYDLPV